MVGTRSRAGKQNLQSSIEEKGLEKKSSRKDKEKKRKAPEIVEEDSDENSEGLFNEEQNTIQSIERNESDIISQLKPNHIHPQINKLKLPDQFDLPACIKCPNRIADRVCVSAICGEENYFELICGKCHLDNHSHQSQDEKPELDVEEFFDKLCTFSHESSLDQQKYNQYIEVEQLSNAFEQISALEAQLSEVKASIQKEIEMQQKPKQTIQNEIFEEISSIFSKPSFDNIQEQFEKMKYYISFEDNEFTFDVANSRRKQLFTLSDSLTKGKKDVIDVISSAFVGKKYLDLNTIQLEVGIASWDKTAIVKIARTNGELAFQTRQGSLNQQLYLGFVLDPVKKYTIRFTVNRAFNGYFFIGLSARSNVDSVNLNDSESVFLYKRFSSGQSWMDCSKVIRGDDSLFTSNPPKNSQYEMRVCIHDQVLEFMTFPGYKNILSKLDSQVMNQQLGYVLTFNIYNYAVITINSIEEGFEFQSY